MQVKKINQNLWRKHHETFIYIRRYENELKSVFEHGSKDNPKSFFDDLKQKFPSSELDAKNKKFYCNGEVFRLC